MSSSHRRRRRRDDDGDEEEGGGGRRSRRRRNSGGRRGREPAGDREDDGDERQELVAQTKACDPEWIVRMRAYLGNPNMNRTQCFLCRAARHDSALVQMSPWNEMAEIYRRGQLETDPIAVAYTLSRHFEFQIRQPANDNLKAGQVPVPELRAVDIYWHYKMHMLEASNELYNTIREIRSAEYLLIGDLRKPVIKADGKRGYSARKKIVPLLNMIWTQKRQYMSLKPERMAFHNPTYGLSVADVSAFANKNQNWQQINVEDYLSKETAKRAKVTQGSAEGGAKRSRSG